MIVNGYCVGRSPQSDQALNNYRTSKRGGNSCSNKYPQREQRFGAPAWLKAQANLQDLEGERARSLADPDAFWGEWARRFQWFKPWDKVMDWQYPDHQWFVGGETNITLNALDRHADGANRTKLALIWIAEDGSERKVTYYELRQLVSQFASGLRCLGVQKGDTVVIYMPLTLEGVIAMLACARLGAIHSVVYAGMGVGALRDRILDAGAKVIIAGNVGIRRARPWTCAASSTRRSKTCRCAT